MMIDSVVKETGSCQVVLDGIVAITMKQLTPTTTCYSVGVYHCIIVQNVHKVRIKRVHREVLPNEQVRTCLQCESDLKVLMYETALRPRAPCFFTIEFIAVCSVELCSENLQPPQSRGTLQFLHALHALLLLWFQHRCYFTH